MTNSPADAPDPAASSAIRRRTVLAGAAWSVPAIALATSAPAYAQSGTAPSTLTFSQAPASTPACSATTSPFVAQLSGPDNVGKLVQFSLPSGWSWTSGSGSYVTDSDGFATAPAGAITANSTSGTVTATTSSLTAATTVTAALYGTIQTNRSAAAFPSGSNANIVRMYASLKGIVVAKTTGEIWSWYDGGAWTQVGTGADTDAGRMSFIDATGTQAALWIKSGVLQVGGSPAAIPSASNADFVRVAASGPIALAVRSNGDLWRWDEATGWAKAAIGVATGVDQMACFFGSTKTECYWIRGGQLFSGAGLVDMESYTNSEVLRLYATAGFDANGADLALIKSNGEAYSYITPTGWRLRDTGADTGPGRATSWTVGKTGAVATLKSGELWTTPNDATAMNTTSHSGGWQTFSNNSIITGICRPDKLSAWLNGWNVMSTNVAADLGQMAAPVNDVWNSPVFWITPVAC